MSRDDFVEIDKTWTRTNFKARFVFFEPLFLPKNIFGAGARLEPPWKMDLHLGRNSKKSKMYQIATSTIPVR